MGLYRLGKRRLNENLPAADYYLGRIIKKMELDFRIDSYQKDLSKIPTKERVVGQKDKTIFLEDMLRTDNVTHNSDSRPLDRQ
ncbi:hypothetical protein BTVI_105959 [Pitangus sulphuratus]|nr:hypothetical protein BTVI_105959 [Pitangus sulphuratus]